MTRDVSIGNFQPFSFFLRRLHSERYLMLGGEIHIKFTRSENRQINLYSYDTYQREREEERNAMHNVCV